MTDVVAAAPNLHRWQQLYPFNDRELTLHFVREAERLGFSALVVTVDSPVPGYDDKLKDLFLNDMSNNPLYR